MTPAEYAARIIELENELALTREAIKPFSEYIRARGSWPDNTPIVATGETMRPITAHDFRRLAACGNPA